MARRKGTLLLHLDYDYLHVLQLDSQVGPLPNLQSGAVIEVGQLPGIAGHKSIVRATQADSLCCNSACMPGIAVLAITSIVISTAQNEQQPFGMLLDSLCVSSWAGSQCIENLSCGILQPKKVEGCSSI